MAKTLTRQEFAELAAKEVLKLLPDGEYETKVQDITKPSGSYIGVIIKKTGNCTAPSLNSDMYYERYINGDCLKDIFEEMADIATRPLPSFLGNDLATLFKSFEAAQDRLAVRMFATEKVENTIHREVIDGISIVPYIVLDNTKRGLTSARVTEDMVNMWDVTEEQVLDEALSNSEEIFPPKMFNMAETFGDTASAVNMQVITTQSGNNGAISILYDGVLDDMRETMGGDFYLLPSSVNEFITIPYGDKAAKELLRLVQAMNDTLEPQECLITAVYSYRDGELRREA